MLKPINSLKNVRESNVHINISFEMHYLSNISWHLAMPIEPCCCFPHILQEYWLRIWWNLPGDRLMACCQDAARDVILSEIWTVISNHIHWFPVLHALILYISFIKMLIVRAWMNNYTFHFHLDGNVYTYHKFHAYETDLSLKKLSRKLVCH